MPFLSMLLPIALAAQATPPVPGLCSATPPADPDAAGCYLSAELPIDAAPARLYWHIYRFPDAASAKAAAVRQRWATIVSAHRQTWLYVMTSEATPPIADGRRGVAGPFAVAAGKPIVARFMQSVFPPGMKTRVHRHSGPEAFYVVHGQQCMETPTERRMIEAGNTYVVAAGPHLQAAPRGRRNLVLILAPAGAPWMALDESWQPSAFCDG
ncbi:cupin domain-containing protein [Sphingomonas radiodurans]|uniref:cupin domain-containing protein n=1 Tax=Sphingomonas radiodurans TaxID=2890321 RepID=UPI001E6277F0|nr:hypothetical protein [Sphingomonas radiodurans]WBH15908.1 hypothetical protein LLW23_14005 [Sphingomonas radiodurans]